MSSSLSYFAENHALLKDTYAGDCLVIARELGRRLIAEGKQPYICTLVRVQHTPQGRFHGPIMPQPYDGRITWTRHYVCCCDGLVYDPLLEKPAPIDQYSLMAFAINIPIETFIRADEMQEYLSKATGYARAGLTKSER